MINDRDVSGRSIGFRRRRFLITALGLAAVLLTGLSVGGSAEEPAAQVSESPMSKGPVKPMRIGVIGTGPLGGTVGRIWVEAGHEVMFSSRNPEALVPLIRDLGPRASKGTSREAAEFGTVLLFAVPYDALPQLGRDLQEAIRGKIVLDACNPSAADNALAREARENGVGPTSAKYLPATRLVRAFSAADALFVDASFKRQNDKLGVPLAGDDPEAVQVAAQLVRDAGCEPVVVGNLAAAASFQRGGPGFPANTTAAKLRRLLGLPEEK